MFFKSPTGKIVITLLLCGLIGFCFYSLLVNNFRLSWGETTRRKLLLYTGDIVDLFADKLVDQTFVANYPGLSQIDVLLQNDDQLGGVKKITLHLRDICTSEIDIFHGSIEIPPTTESVFYTFSFPPIDDSAGRSYCLILEASEVSSEAPIRLILSKGDLYPFGELTVHNHGREQIENKRISSPSTDNQITNLPYKIFIPIVSKSNPVYNADIGFKLRYKGQFWPTVQIFVARLIANKPYFLGDPRYYSGLVLLYVILLIGLFYVARKTIQLGRK